MSIANMQRYTRTKGSGVHNMEASLPGSHVTLVNGQPYAHLSLTRTTTYTCAFKSDCLMSHNWLHTPDCKVKHEKHIEKKNQ